MVYLICFDAKLKHAKRYLGYTERETIEQRLQRHRDNNGARILQVLNALRIGYEVVRIWPEGDRAFERKLKRTNNTKRYCPRCNGQTR